MCCVDGEWVSIEHTERWHYSLMLCNLLFLLCSKDCTVLKYSALQTAHKRRMESRKKEYRRRRRQPGGEMILEQCFWEAGWGGRGGIMGRGGGEDRGRGKKKE